MKSDEDFIKIAIEEAKKGDFPYGAVLTKAGKVISIAHNTKITDNDATAHAEINAIRKACKLLKTIKLIDCTLYVNSEPCPMCFSAAWRTEINKIVYGADRNDEEISCKEMNEASGNRIELKSGVLRDACLKSIKGGKK